MKLTQDQVAQFDREGYLFFPSLFCADEIRVLTEDVALPWKDGTPAQELQGGLKAA